MTRAVVNLRCENCQAVFSKEKICDSKLAAENYAEWAKETFVLCPTCYKKKQSALWKIQQQRENEINKNILAVYNFPPIKGTEKQIQWATTIRNNAIGPMVSHFMGDTLPADFLDFIKAKTSAKWWIDNRSILLEDWTAAADFIDEQIEKEQARKT